MGITGTGYIRRSEFLVLADVSATATPEWELIGDKVESLNLALNPNVETITDITGVTSTTLDRYQVQTDVTPMRARREQARRDTIRHSKKRENAFRRRAQIPCGKRFLTRGRAAHTQHGSKQA